MISKAHIICLVVLLGVVAAQAGYVFPTFDGDRSPWLELQNNGTPIVIESGSIMGLTNTNVGLTSYKLRLIAVDPDTHFYSVRYPDYVEGYVEFHITNMHPAIMEMYGTHTGPGNPFGNFSIITEGTIFVEYLDVDQAAWMYMGSFTVVPEPATIFLFAIGAMLCRKK
jgi:hypothetical protein